MQQGKSNLYAWFVFLLAASFLFYKYLVFVVPAIITTALIQRYSLSATALGFGVSIYFYSYLIMQIPAGLLIDRYGTRIWTSLAILNCAMGMLLMGMAHTWVVFCIGRFLVGFGTAFAITAYMKLVSIWFPTDYFALMASFFGIACMAGAGTAETPLAWLMIKLHTQNMLILSAGIGLLLSLIFWFTVKDKQQEKQAQQPKKDHSFTWDKALQVLKKPANIGLILYTGLCFTPLTVFAGFWGIPFVMQAYHVDTVNAASIVSFSFFGFIAGGIAGDPLAKKTKSPRMVLVIGNLLTLFFLAVIIYVSSLSTWVLMLCFFLFGVFSSVYLLNYGFANRFNALKEMSTAIGMMNMAGPLASLIVEPFIGKVLDLYGYHTGLNQMAEFSIQTYQIAFIALIVCLILACFCCALIKNNCAPDKCE